MFAQETERCNMGACKICDMDIITDAGAVAGGIVVAPHLHLRQLANGGLCNGRNEVGGAAYGQLANLVGRMGARGQDRKAIDRFTRELIPLVLNGPPGATGFGDGRPPVREIVAYWSALVPREEIKTTVEVLG